MKNIILSMMILYSISSFSQIENADKVPDCELTTIKVVNQLSTIFSNSSIDSFDKIIEDWKKVCGISECTQRLIVLKNILERKSSKKSIEIYFENSFHNVHRNRIEDSRRIDFGYKYSVRKLYYGYVPLRHSIDSVIMRESTKLFESGVLNPDEKLICLMFSGDIEAFDKEFEKSGYDESFVKKYLLREYRKESNRWLSYTIYSGVFKPVSSNDVFNYSPMFGFTFGSPLSNKLIVELGFKIRFNINDESFNYYALDEMNEVNSPLSIFFGGMLGYKIFENEKVMLIPKFGIGLESIDTNISEKKQNDTNRNYENLETIHLSIGISGMIPVFKKNYTGIGLNYHFCPYGLDENLHTNIDNNSFSAEVFFKF